MDVTPGSLAALIERARQAGGSTKLQRALESETSWIYTARPEDLERAETLLADTTGSLPAGFAWRAGYAHHTQGRYERAMALYARARRDTASSVDIAHLHAATAASEWARGNAPESRRRGDAALAAARACGDDSALAFAWIAQALCFAREGDRNANYGAYQRAVGFARAAGDELLQARIHNNLGSLCNEEARYRDAIEHLQPST